jgi:hypothetical protein
MRIEFYVLFHIGCFGSNDPAYKFKNLTWVDIFFKNRLCDFFFIFGYFDLMIWIAGFAG